MSKQGSVSNYDQSVIINGFRLSGVQDLNGSYTIQKTPINILGQGHVLSLLNAPTEGNFSFSRNMISEDPLLNLTGNSGFSGTIDYLEKSFGFSGGYLTSYSVSCGIGQIPTINTDITVFGDIGSGLSHDATGTHPAIYTPSQGSIFIECEGTGTNRITSFDYNINVNREPIYKVGSKAPVEVCLIKPLEMTANFTLSVDDYETKRVLDILESPQTSNIKVLIKSADLSQTLQTYEIANASLISETLSSTTEEEMTVNLSYQGYLN